MPEGPEVKTTTRWLHNNCSSYTIINISQDLNYLKGWTISEVSCKGKHIFFHLIKLYLDTTYKIYFKSHLGMTGRWSNMAADHTKFSMELRKSWCGGEHIFILHYIDIRGIGSSQKIIDEIGYQDALSNIGPDLLSEYVPIELWFEKFRNTRLIKKEIAGFLLDQDRFCGIGNYLKSEILYRSKIRPDRPLGSLSDNDLITLYNVTIETIKESYTYGGLTIKDYQSPDGNMGTFNCKVYNKTYDEYGFQVRRDTFKDNRSTFWVPEVQR